MRRSDAPADTGSVFAAQGVPAATRSSITAPGLWVRRWETAEVAGPVFPNLLRREGAMRHPTAALLRGGPSASASTGGRRLAVPTRPGDQAVRDWGCRDGGTGRSGEGGGGPALTPG